MIDSFTGKHFYLSNFFDIPVEYEGITYQNSESAYQASKTFTERERFQHLSPSSAKKLGYQVPLREDWEKIKLDVMKDVCRAKFQQNPKLLEKLLATGDEELVEGNNWGDRYWGCVNGAGKNHLGIILMELRSEFAEQRASLGDFPTEYDEELF